MKIRHHLLAVFLIITLLVSSGCSASGSSAASATTSDDTWTVLFYMCGTDLESDSATEPGGSYNLREITKTTPTDNVHFIVETGGCKEWHAKDLGLDISTDKLQRYSYTKEGFELVDEQPGASMGDSKTLSDFISWGKENYPADKYMLVMWDHGSGVHGLLSDELFPNQSGNSSMLTLNEWEQALKDGGVNFELILTDCCLMANLETAQMLAPYAKYLVASEEVFPGKGSASDMWLQYLSSSPGSDGLKVGRLICDTTQQKYKDLHDDFTSETLTLSVIDLSKIDAVAKAFDNMFKEIGGMLTDLTTFHEVAYYTSLADTFSYGDMTTGMVDLTDFANKAYLGTLSEKAMLDITNTVADCVVYQVKGTEHSYAGGLSFYRYTDVCGTNRLERYGSTCRSAPYLAYIDAIADEWEAPDWVYDEVDHFTVSEDFKVPTATAGQKEDGTFYADFENEECLISVGYNLKSFDANNSVWLDLGYSFNVNYDEADGMATMAFDGKWVGLNGEPVNLDLANETNESVSFNIPIVLKYSDSSTQETRIREQFQYARNENNEIVSTALSDGRWITLGYWFRYENGQGIPSRAQYPVYSLAGNTAQVAYPVYEADGNYRELGTTGNDFTLGYDVDVEMIDLPAGQYMVTFTFTDIFGNKNLQTEPIIFNLVD